MRRLALDVLPEEYVVARMDPQAEIPDAILTPDNGALVSVTRTHAELSVVCPAHVAPVAARTEPGWRVLTVRGPLDFTLTGILAAVSSELAAAGVTLFSLSTFDTDHILVRQTYVDRAAAALRAAGHEVHGV